MIVGTRVGTMVVGLSDSAMLGDPVGSLGVVGAAVGTADSDGIELIVGTLVGANEALG